ncbi:MAG: sialate O-acetylesterase [Dysgonamonadaceae bacterium]|jgi:sialate O-acetylesterase|nr:sialate O-acetylesterase [Dysgonamonadaceae bacterium]
MSCLVKYGFLSFILCFALLGEAKVKLPALISNGMVLQRDMPVKIWGWADANETVKLQLSGQSHQTFQTEADKNGNWEITLPAQPAGIGYTLIINDMEIKDVMFGDVWICSGQSNMELPVHRVLSLYKQVPANPQIKQFLVPQTYNFHAPQTDFASGRWATATPITVVDFSAVAYFFALELYDRYKVPIGLINNALGGSPAEAWIGEDSLRRYPHYYSELQRFKDDKLVEGIIVSDRERIHAWYDDLYRKDKGYASTMWYSDQLNTNDWSSMNVPGYWTQENAQPVNGSMWFRKTFSLPDSLSGQPAKLILGAIVDADSVYVNGQFVGATGYQYPPRRYDLATGILKAGENTLTVRVISESGRGGFVEGKFYGLEFKHQTVDLSGSWRYKLGAQMEPLQGETFIRWKPAGLYNAMLSPMFNYAIKGVIWYQGESNTGKPAEYQELFTTLIRNWRNQWKQGDFPFLYVQLANFMKSCASPTESNWAELRESQLKTLALPNTGMAVTIDIGEWNDIHPLNKQDAGERLALVAKKIAYKENDVVYSGPVYKSMQIDGSKIILSFNHTGSGIMFKNDGENHAFAIAGKDMQFVWASAKIENNKVVVWNDNVAQPVAVRYAWADNPENADLYNLEGLPASPFRTDITIIKTIK